MAQVIDQLVAAPGEGTVITGKDIDRRSIAAKGTTSCWNPGRVLSEI